MCGQTGAEDRKRETWSLKWAATEDKKAQKQRSIEPQGEHTCDFGQTRIFRFFIIAHRYCLWGEEGGLRWIEFNWTWRQLQSGNDSSRLSTETLAVPASLRRTNICLVLLSINTLLTGDTLVLFQEPGLMAAAERARRYFILGWRSSHRVVTFVRHAAASNLPAIFQCVFLFAFRIRCCCCAWAKGRGRAGGGLKEKLMTAFSLNLW